MSYGRRRGRPGRGRAGPERHAAQHTCSSEGERGCSCSGRRKTHLRVLEPQVEAALASLKSYWAITRGGLLIRPQCREYSTGPGPRDYVCAELGELDLIRNKPFVASYEEGSACSITALTFWLLHPPLGPQVPTRCLLHPHVQCSAQHQALGYFHLTEE